jgi:Predicted nucleotide-binding protein containing TIR-like domain
MVYGINLDDDMLRSRYLQPYGLGSPVTGGGRSVPSHQIDQVLVVETDDQVSATGAAAWNAATSAGTDRTDDFVLGAPGYLRDSGTEALGPGVRRDPARVMVVHGRNLAALNALRSFLQAVGLVPILWEDAIEETGEGSPHNLDAVTVAMALAQAVVVLFTTDDEARLMPQLNDGNPDEAELRGQPRPNVLIEAGMAIALGRERTILTRLGRIRPASDLDGLNAVNLTNDPGPRTALRRRLLTAGCRVNDRSDYLESAVAGDFDSAQSL